MSQGHPLGQGKRETSQNQAREEQVQRYHEAALTAQKKKQERDREKLEKKWARYAFLNTTAGYTLQDGSNTSTVESSTLTDTQKDLEMKLARLKLQQKYDKFSE